MSTFQSIYTSIRGLPRAGQWLVWAMILVVGFLVWDEFVWQPSGEWSNEADNIEKTLDEMPRTVERQSDLGRLSPAIYALGEVSLPSSATAAKDELMRAVNETMAAHEFTNDRFTVHEMQNLPGKPIQKLLAPGQQAKSIGGELVFEASPEEAIAVIAELESRSEIEQISRMNLQLVPSRAGVDRVKVTMVLQSWVIGADSRQRGGSS